MNKRAGFNLIILLAAAAILLLVSSSAVFASSVPDAIDQINAPGSPSLIDSQFETAMAAQGFSETYMVRLRELHQAHPNWTFAAYNTGIPWTSALAAQSKKGISLVSARYPSSYRSSSKQVEKGWYQANSTVIGYFMDPRNFLNEESIYMFEDLTYRPEFQSEAVVNMVLSGCRLPQLGFTARLFVNAGAANNISPVFLASRARQETGSGGMAVDGSSVLGTVYNPFNIGALGNTDPLYNGLLYARAAGWDTAEKAINCGAMIIADRYISKGQNTLYYQRFNVRNGAAKAGTHQYMTNIMAPFKEAKTTMQSYAKYGITSQSIVFEIPIYSGMPAATNLP